jgi:hypothetical protein
MSHTFRRIRYSFGWRLQCDQHRGYGPLPCPWPGCPNGVPEDGLEVFGDHLTDRRHIRIEWPPFQGEAYYSWEDTELGPWFNAEIVISGELNRRSLPFATPSLAYHYTSATGLQGIIEQNELWLTDFAYLNDVREIEHGISVAERILNNPPASVSAELLPKWNDALRTTMPARMCMAAFSLDGDSLSQWRAYGNVSLGFDLAGDFGTLSETSADGIVYDPQRQDDLICLFFHHYSAALERDSKARANDVLAVDATIGRLHRRLAFLKDPGFAGEREVRLSYFEQPEVLASFQVPVAPRRFRVSGGRLVSYVTTHDLARRAPQRLPLRRVVVGPQPNADVVLRGVTDFLISNGYDDTEVVQSSIPFRRRATFGDHDL